MENSISQDVSSSVTMDRRCSSPNRGFIPQSGFDESSFNRSLIDMGIYQSAETEGFTYPELCQTDQATLSCALAHLKEPDPKIVAEFSPFVCLDSVVISDLTRRIRSDSVMNTDRQPVFSLVSRLVSAPPIALATVVLPIGYEPRMLRVAVSATDPESVWQAACESVIVRLEDHELDVSVPDEMELDVVAVDACLDEWGSRLSLLWKSDPQLQIPESVYHNNVVEVVPAKVNEEFQLQKAVTFINPDSTMQRYVVRADEDTEAVMKAVQVASEKYEGMSHSWTNSAVFVDTVIQTDGSAFVVHVS